jgi:N-acetylglucosaminyldiphosphoundecaprenol N-acetyl-beta-D-mannosaminyltransferase
LSLAAIDGAAAATWILAAAEAQQPSVVVTSNINHVRLVSADPTFRKVVRKAELNVGDGWPLVAASRILPGVRLPGRVAGIDLVSDVLDRGRHLRVAILGGPPTAAAGLASRVAGRHEIALVDPLPKDAWKDGGDVAGLCTRLSAATPNLTLIGIGPPRQELLANEVRAHVSGPIICCGAAIEVLAGVRRRAPRILQGTGLEWAFRLALEPRRLGPRYLMSGLAFVRILGRELATSRGNRT